MGPSKDPAIPAENQAPRSPRGWGYEERVRRPRKRVCLLKGCERQFRPMHALTRYCSQECREEARRWREWKARHRYRQSEGSKQKRRAQSRRYRMRHPRAGEAKSGPGTPREGHRKKNYFAVPVIARAATRSSNAADARRCSDFARGCADGLWSGFWSENAAGGNGNRSGESAGSERPGDSPEILRFLSRGE
jgi:hypothetical protein